MPLVIEEGTVEYVNVWEEVQHEFNIIEEPSCYRIPDKRVREYAEIAPIFSDLSRRHKSRSWHVSRRWFLR